MSTAMAEKGTLTKPKRKAPQPEQKANGAVKRPAKSKSISWKMILMVLGILGMMALLFSPNDPSAIKGHSNASFGKGVLAK